MIITECNVLLRNVAPERDTVTLLSIIILNEQILAFFKSNEVVTSIPFCPSGGDLFVLSTENPLKIDDWKRSKYVNELSDI